MKPITEEQRQELIEFILAAQDSMSGNEPVNTERFDIGKLTQGVFEIALASLAAEPVGSITSVTCINGGRTEARVYMRDPGVPNKLGDVYAGPPVPVIKLPDEFDDYSHQFEEFRRGHNACLDEIKRLNELED